MIVNAIIGHAIGDVIGVPYEMCPRKILKRSPIKGINAKNRYSDDTAMTLATMQAIIDNNGEIDYEDIMYNFYLWIATGKFTQEGQAYGYGGTTFKAINNYSLGVPALNCGINSFYSNGNGALMRMLPIIFYLHKTKANEDKILEVVSNITKLTHAHEINTIGTYIFTRYCLYLLDGYSKKDSYKKIQELNYKMFSKNSLKYYKIILHHNIYKFNVKRIRSGIAIYETLEAVLWTILNTNNFKDAILTAVNLGGDTDTIGAITGGVAGILYNNRVSKVWAKKINGFEYIESMAKEFESIINNIN